MFRVGIQILKNILVAVESCEFTTIASPLIERALELANAFSGKIWLLHVLPHSQQPPFNLDSETARRETAAEFRNEHEFLQQLAKCIQERDIDVTAILVQGSIIKSILKESERMDADLIVLGCRKHGRLAGVLMDSTEEGLLSKCTRPIMFIPESEE